MFNFKLTLLIGVMLSGDMALMVAAIWQTLSLEGSYLHLGILLASMALIPVFLQHYFKTLTEKIQNQPSQVLKYSRAVGIGIVLLSLLMAKENLLSIMLILACFAAVLFFTQQSLEVLIMQQVQSSLLTSQDAARILQVGIQLSAFSGMAIGGWLLHQYGMTAVCLYLMVTLLIGFGVSTFLPASSNPQIKTDDNTQNEQGNDGIVLSSTLLLVGMASLMVHNGSFNFFIPTLFNQEKLWGADSYGYFSACISIGALITWIPLGKSLFARLISFFSLFAAVLCCYFIVELTNPVQLYCVAVGLGYFANLTRLKIREKLYEETSASQNVNTAKLLTMISMSIPALVPIVLGASLTYFNVPNIGDIFIFIAAASFTTMAACLYGSRFKKQYQMEKVGNDG
jgi:hypothetical protein